MKFIPHLTLTLALAVTTFVVHITIQKSDSVKLLDTARVYTMMREKGDTQNALELLNDDKWLDPACQAMTDLTATGANVLECKNKRVDLRDTILSHLKCTVYNSQVCSYLRLVLASLAKTSTTEWIDNADHTLGHKVVGHNLADKPTGGDELYREILYEAVEDSAILFHGSYKAVESESFIVLRSLLYNLITFAMLGNFIVHVLSSYKIVENHMWTRILTLFAGFFGTFFVSSVLVFVNPGAWGPLLLISIPAFFNLGYFEMFLDPTMVRPWIHPYTFTMVYSSLSVLSLVENDVLNYAVLVVEVLKAQAASQLYMSVVWYWVGLQEKLRLKSKLLNMYRTKEVQWALYVSLIMVMLFPLTSYFAPYDYSHNFEFMASSPAFFAILALVSTLYLQDLRLDDQYDDSSINGDTSVPPTHLTSSKLYVALLMLGFTTLVVFNLLGEHWRTYRSTLDALPDKAMQYDLSMPFLMGQGLTGVHLNF
jgi:hypothetical protein